MSKESKFDLGEPIGQIQLNGQPIEVLEVKADLPTGSDKLEVCQYHISEGGKGTMMDEFWMAGAHFPEAEQEQVICLQFSCPGQSLLRKRCRLTLTQYDSGGRELTSGTFNE